MGRKKKEVKRKYERNKKRHGLKGGKKTHNRVCANCDATENLYYCYTGPKYVGKLLCPDEDERKEYMEERTKFSR